MKNDLESILAINRYLLNSKNDIKKKEIVRGYLTSKLNSMLESPKKEVVTSLFNIPLTLLSL